MDSLWSKTVERPEFAPLSGNRKTDVLIIGGGMTGILCAYMLHWAGVDCLLVEADRICGGITKDTTAKITLQHGLIYCKLLSTFGLEGAQAYFDANRGALERYRSLCAEVECDFRQTDSYVYSLHDRKILEEELSALEQIGASASLVSDLSLPFSVAGAVKMEGQGSFHPLKFAFGLAKDLPIHEHTKVRELMPGKVVTDRGTIAAEHIIVATHFPYLNKHGAYFMKLYQHRSYVLALRDVPAVKGMYVDASGSGLSFRDTPNGILLGGGGHRTGKTGKGWDGLEQFARQYYPNATIIARWATQDCMSLDGVPYIGAYSNRTSNLYVATGYNKWGMTSSMVAATLLADLIRGIQSPYGELFSPSRSILRPQLLLNLGESVKGLLTPFRPRCPHLGCALRYNPREHSWDCSCHGSRFSSQGELIDNPATDDLT